MRPAAAGRCLPCTAGGGLPPGVGPGRRQMGAAAVFPPGTVIEYSALVMLERMGVEEVVVEGGK